MAQKKTAGTKGCQRLPIRRLKAWEKLEYGMFIHYGMSTYDGDECSKGDKPASWFRPTNLDVNQWIRTARDAGMRYAVLTAKHHSGFCLWPTAHTGYHVGRSSCRTDVVEAFFTACAKYGVKPGLYYASWDNHNLFGSKTPTFHGWKNMGTTQAYRDFQMKQIEELLTCYGKVVEMWIDIPGILGAKGRRDQYAQIASLCPGALIMMNSGLSDGSKLNEDFAWPTDLMAIERYLPGSNRGYKPWFKVKAEGEKLYYLPGEVCDPIGYEWFWKAADKPRSDAELLGMRLICRERKANLLLNVPPDKRGRLPEASVKALLRLAKNISHSPA